MTDKSSTPALTVNLKAPDSFATQLTTIRHLRNQTICDQIEVIVVCAHDVDRELVEPEMVDFHSYQLLVSGDKARLPEQQVIGARHAKAPFIAYGEDHCAPHPKWAEALVNAFNREDKPAGIAVAMHNANPQTMFSWGNLAYGYLNWMAPVPEGRVDYTPLTNGTYRVDVLRKYDDKTLVRLLARGGAINQRIREDGGHFWQEPEAKAYHKNPSTWGATWTLRVNAGRGIMGGKVIQKKMGLAMKLLSALLLPLTGLYRVLKVIKRLVSRKFPITFKIVGGVVICSMFEMVGQYVGLFAGKGNSRDILYNMEFHRERFMRENEKGQNAVAQNDPSVVGEGYIDPLKSAVQ